MKKKFNHNYFFFLLSRLTLSALGVKLNDYWKDLTEKQARAPAFQGVSRGENEEEHGNDE